ncbi:MAG: hypothetical protein Q8M20_08810 [Rhodocyclaceae bacterium]|nr:hypothetical protein [Rhodocyclaceae bacterium]MDZ4215483.1 hypothetical protein [Rhodocyclaceae bacterium]
MSLPRILLLLMVMFAPLVQAQAPVYVGLIDRLSGQVSAKSAAGNRFEPSAFSRLREGDEITLAAGAEMQIVLFESRRREPWQGPASFRLRTAGGEVLTGKAAQAIDIKGAPSRVSLAAAGNVQRIGGLTLRSAPGRIPDDATVAQAQADYAAWVASAEADDILPELYMIGLLQERREPALLKPYVEAMLKKQPEHADVRALAERVTQQARPR